ncbi:hypothetical protein N7457_003929 [Penicillium paradoxum]|uniref:uncharacterized protein n=1 Tax=Penicillium paradoxum TaxID=176176 RepID=UPI002548E6AA|nr:uncharacterized protein N7457_003929 [Penicillium paradoxum]KAJ5782155.1 hypothetical protein N7457_003929 [Penicillium paradoxum]
MSVFGSRRVIDDGFDFQDFFQALKNTRQGGFDDFDDRLVIGIDFGTTFSGVSWATIDDFERNKIQTISSWPGASNQESKAPTRLFYEDGKMFWGYEVPDDAEPLQWFKLLLLRDDDLPPDILANEFVLKTRRMLKEERKTAVECTAEYLKALWRHTIKSIRSARGNSVVTNSTFHVVITIPAIWKDYAREAMKEAAEKAGILKRRTSAGETILTFVPEPEAAGLASLGLRRRHLKTGEVYVICDAGGGTVDVISYRVGELKPITLHEAVIGAGGLCGGIFVDAEFKAMCKARLGRRWSKLSLANIKHIMDSEWETKIKIRYQPNSQRPNIVAIPDDAFRGSDRNDTERQPPIINGSIHFSSSDIQKTFTEVFAEIDILLDDQIQSARDKGLSVKGIILVGGFGTSPYLSRHLEDRYKYKNLKVIHSSDMNPGTSPRTAICRGAVFKGFIDGPGGAGRNTLNTLNIGSTIARQSLGTLMSLEFVEGVHREKDKYLDATTGGWRARNQIRWYLYKGQDVSKSDPIQHLFHRTYTNESDFKNTAIKTIFLQCDSENPPTQRDSTVSELCTIEWNTSDISYYELEDNYGRYGPYKYLDYEIEVRPSGASNDFAIIYQGEKLDSRNAHVAYE